MRINNSMIEANDKLLTTKEVSIILRCSIPFVIRSRSEGELKAIKFKRKVLFRESDVYNFIQSKTDYPNG